MVDLDLGETVYATEKVLEALDEERSRRWLEVDYAACLYGGWTHPDGRVIDRPGRIGIELHEAAKALFCKACHAEGEGRMVHVGQMGESWEEVFVCPECGCEATPMGCFTYRTLFMDCGTGAGKDFYGESEFVAWLMGRRPWDNTVSMPMGSDRTFGMCAQSLGVAHSIIAPYFELRAGGVGEDKPLLAKRVTNTQKQISHWLTQSGDKVFLFSHQQYYQAGQRTNIFEGHNFFAFFWSEPPPQGARTAVTRGLARRRAHGGGREIIAATPIYSHYLYNSVYQQAGNLGGPAKHIFVIHGTIYDNPSLSKSEIEEYLSDCPPEEREARATGKFMSMIGRVYPDYDESVHGFDTERFDPITHDACQDWPIVMAVDPHDRRPWVMVYAVITPMGDYWICREWPEGWYQQMRRHTDAGADGSFSRYAEIIRGIESEIPNAGRRILYRYMDPKFGPSQKTGTEFQSVQEAMMAHGLFFDTEIDAMLETRHAAVRELLSIPEPEEPLSQMNRPRLRVAVERCKNTNWSFHNYTNKPETDNTKELKTAVLDVGKDQMDGVGWIAVKAPRFTRVGERKSDPDSEAEGWENCGLGAA